jgi:hypothetical protein
MRPFAPLERLMAQDIPRMSLLRRHLSPFTQLILVAVVGVANFTWPVIDEKTADQSERAGQIADGVVEILAGLSLR